MTTQVVSAGEIIRQGLSIPAPDQKPPEKPAEEIKTDDVPAVAAPAPKADDKLGVDGDRERDGGGERHRTKQDTIRQLRQDRRELRAAIEKMEANYQQQITQLAKKLEGLQPGNAPAETDEDYLAKLLTKPKALLDEREKALVGRLEALEHRIDEYPSDLRQRQEKSEAFKRIKGLDGFNHQDTDAWDDLVDLISDRTGLDTETLYQLAETQPGKFSQLSERHWNESRKLSAGTIKDKAAASSASAGGGKTGGTVTLEDLNKRYAVSTDKEEQRRIEEEMISILEFQRKK